MIISVCAYMKLPRAQGWNETCCSVQTAEATLRKWALNQQRSLRLLLLLIFPSFLSLFSFFLLRRAASPSSSPNYKFDAAAQAAQSTMPSADLEIYFGAH